MRKILMLILPLGLITTAALAAFGLYLNAGLPSVARLKDAPLQVPLRIYTADHKLIATYGEKRRIPIRFDEVPQPLIDAVLATEDRRFYEHTGVDLRSLLRAGVHLLLSGTKGQGGSTITMQVARNFFLTRRKTYTRKLNEILLALKIERELSKHEILELYLNKIFLGNRAYGVAAAARVYYGKSLDQLNLPQWAMIAGLPKAPSNLNPLANPKAALERRHHVLSRMLHYGDISQKTFDEADATPISASYHEPKIDLDAPYIAETVRQELLAHFGEDAYTSGFQVITTINSRLQHAARSALHNALLAYDKRHGYRGPLGHFDTPPDDVTKALAAYPHVGDLDIARVAAVHDKAVVAELSDDHWISITWPNLVWARKQTGPLRRGPVPKKAADILKVNDIIAVHYDKTQGLWQLAQIPEAEAALVAMNPHNGAIVALQGGFDYDHSKFNRITQAQRQPGSGFKPFIYSAALAKGLTAATLINDAPVVLDDPSEEQLWRPQNDSRRFYGPTRLRIGLIKSRNLVSIRLLKMIGVDYALDYLKRFGFRTKALPRSLSLALGSGTLTPLELATGYCVFANGGYRVKPYDIARIEDSEGSVLYKTAIPEHRPATKSPPANTAQTPAQALPEDSTDVGITPQNAYLMTHLLQDAIQHGTGRGAKVLHRHDIAGKTGTTNDKQDAWFSGFNADLVTVAWMGFDAPRSLGEYGAQAALPLWIDFMRQALTGQPETTLLLPANLVTVRIDPQTGLLARANQSNAIFELFRQELAPTQYAPASRHTPPQTPHTQSPATDPHPANTPLQIPEQVF